MELHGFRKYHLPLGNDIFHTLAQSVDFQPVAKGRQGNHLVQAGKAGIPIVRTTTAYSQPAHYFSELHGHIAESIYPLSKIETKFNHALIEIYDRQYTTMKYHSDQCMDLAENSWIALFSCYEMPDTLSSALLRRLKIKNKTTAEEFEIALEHNSVVLFSLPTNAAFQHKIILEKPHDNRWLGITFRESKTFIQFKHNLPYFADDTPLVLADEAQSKEFYQLRTQENNTLDFKYPRLAYTLSMADALLPV